MACTRKTKTLVSTCVILSGMTNIVCLLYVGWVTNYIANIYIKVPMPVAERKLEGDKRGDTVRIMERLDRLENVVNQHIQGAFGDSMATMLQQASHQHCQPLAANDSDGSQDSIK